MGGRGSKSKKPGGAAGADGLTAADRADIAASAELSLNDNGPATAAELAEDFSKVGKSPESEVKAALDKLVTDGKAVKMDGGRYGAVVDPGLKPGQAILSSPTYRAASDALNPRVGGAAAYSPAGLSYEGGKMGVRIRDSGIRGTAAEKEAVRQRMRTRTEGMLKPKGMTVAWSPSGVSGTIVHSGD